MKIKRGSEDQLLQQDLVRWFSWVTQLDQERTANTNPLFNVDGEEINRVTAIQPPPSSYSSNQLSEIAQSKSRNSQNISSWASSQWLEALGFAPRKTVIWWRYVRNVPLPTKHCRRREWPTPVGGAYVLHVESVYELTHVPSGNSHLIRTQLNMTLGPSCGRQKLISFSL